jgi:hypothetical protein
MKKYLVLFTFTGAFIGLSACSSGSSSPTPPTIAQPGAAAQCDADPGTSIDQLATNLDSTGLRYASDSADSRDSRGSAQSQDPHHGDHQSPLSTDANGELLSKIVFKAAHAVCTGDPAEKAQSLPKIEAIENYFQPQEDQLDGVVQELDYLRIALQPDAQ